VLVGTAQFVRIHTHARKRGPSLSNRLPLPHPHHSRTPHRSDLHACPGLLSLKHWLSTVSLSHNFRSSTGFQLLHFHTTSA
jgi:hypothetical protein